MSGETAEKESGWTVDTVKEHVLTVIADNQTHIRDLMTEKDGRDAQRFEAQQLALRDALVAQEKAVNAALLAAQTAVAKAETAAEKRFEAVNEFRGQLADQAANLMPRQEAMVLLTSISEKQDALMAAQSERMAGLETRVLENSTRITASENRSKGHLEGWQVLISLFGLIAVLLGIAGAIIGFA